MRDKSEFKVIYRDGKKVFSCKPIVQNRFDYARFKGGYTVPEKYETTALSNNYKRR